MLRGRGELPQSKSKELHKAFANFPCLKHGFCCPAAIQWPAPSGSEGWSPCRSPAGLPISRSQPGTGAFPRMFPRFPPEGSGTTPPGHRGVPEQRPRSSRTDPRPQHRPSPGSPGRSLGRRCGEEGLQRGVWMGAATHRHPSPGRSAPAVPVVLPARKGQTAFSSSCQQQHKRWRLSSDQLHNTRACAAFVFLLQP